MNKMSYKGPGYLDLDGYADNYELSGYLTARTTSVYDDAVSLWKLDEASGARYDSIGSNDLTDNNTVGSTSKGVGAPANLPETVASFVAANNEYLSRQRISFADGEVGVAVWIKLSTLGLRGVVNQSRLVANKSSWGLNIENLPNEYAYFSTTTDGSATQFAILDPTDLVGAWHLIQAWRDDAAGKNYLAVDDGVPAEGTSSGLFDAPSDTDLIVGALDPIALPSDYFFNGLMSSLVLFPQALTPEIRAALWNDGDGAVLP